MKVQPLILETEINGQPLCFSIIPMESKFGILFKEHVIAEVAHNENWIQVSGDILPDILLNAVYDKIEEYYE